MKKINWKEDFEFVNEQIDYLLKNYGLDEDSAINIVNDIVAKARVLYDIEVDTDGLMNTISDLLFR